MARLALRGRKGCRVRLGLKGWRVQLEFRVLLALRGYKALRGRLELRESPVWQVRQGRWAPPGCRACKVRLGRRV